MTLGAARGAVARDRVIVLLLAILALALRAWGNGYGFPQPWARPDELRWVRIALGLLEDPDPRWFEWPTLHAYLLAALYWIWGRIGLLLGHYPSWHAYLNPDPDGYPADLVLIGRWLSAVIGALTVPVTWRLGERLGPKGAGLLAALFLAVSFGPVRDAHWALIEALLLLLIIGTLLLVVRALERPTLGRFALAGIAAGLAASAKYSGVTLAAPIAVAALFARRAEGRSVWATPLDRRLLLAGALVVLAFVAGSPFMVVSRKEFMDSMVIREWSYRDASFGTAVGFVHHLVFSLRHSHGLLMEIAGIAGLLWLGLRSPGRMTIVAYTLGTYLAFGPARIVPMRYASSLAPGIVLGAAWLLMEASARARRPKVIVCLLATALAADPLYRVVRLDLLLSREDTRVTARRWLERYVPPPGPIMSRESKALRWGRPALEDRYELVAYGNRLAKRRAAPWALLAESPTGYIPWAPDIDALLREVGTVAAVFDPYAPGARPVYDPHDAFFVPVAGFEGVLVPGPRITLYRLSPAPP
jgi:4-amino-4-deoxy-L-arabinose transferase-like glycosyltransferase